jgi:hypothetical protein
VTHEEPKVVQRKDSRREIPAEDIFATSVTHEDLPPKPRRDSAKKEVSARLRGNDNFGNTLIV